MPRAVDGLTKFQREQDDYRKALATVNADLAAKHTALRELQAKLAASEREARRVRQAQVGKLADDAGLLAYDLGTLEKALLRVAEELRASTPLAVTSASPERLQTASPQA